MTRDLLQKLIDQVYTNKYILLSILQYNLTKYVTFCVKFFYYYGVRLNLNCKVNKLAFQIFQLIYREI